MFWTSHTPNGWSKFTVYKKSWPWIQNGHLKNPCRSPSLSSLSFHAPAHQNNTPSVLSFPLSPFLSLFSDSLSLLPSSRPLHSLCPILLCCTPQQWAPLEGVCVWEYDNASLASSRQPAWPQWTVLDAVCVCVCVCVCACVTSQHAASLSQECDSLRLCTGLYPPPLNTLPHTVQCSRTYTL